MIRSRSEYLLYLEADHQALHKTYKTPKWSGDEIWKFQRLLRKCEYYSNCRRGPVWRLYYVFLLRRLNKLSVLLGFTIPPHTFGPGLSIAHRGTIVVHGKARIGANCRLHVCVNIGTSAGQGDRVPTIGNNVYIGPGAKIFGDITIADGIKIGANAVVNRSFDEPHITIVGVPAKQVGSKGSAGQLTEWDSNV